MSPKQNFFQFKNFLKSHSDLKLNQKKFEQEKLRLERLRRKLELKERNIEIQRRYAVFALEKKVKERTRELEIKTKEIEASKITLMSILKDFELARDKAEEERNKTLSIIKNFSDGLLVFNTKNEVILSNPIIWELLGLKEKNIIGVKAEDLGKEVKRLAKLPSVILENKKIKIIRRQEFSPQKELVLEISIIPLKKEQEITGYLAIFHDITREKIVERLKTEFVSLSAHQLRTPLSAIKWSLSLLKEKGLKEKEKQDLIEKLWLSNERMIKLVNDLLNVTRIEEGRYLYKPKPKDFIEIVKQVILPLTDLAQRKDVKLEYSFPKNIIPKANIDEEKIALCVENLIDNAIHYTHAGGTVMISVKYDKKKKEILFSIQDTGVGIPKAQQKRIFTKFFRSENVTKIETEGSGLGLFIAKNIIYSHKGRIWFESQEGRGTVFYFTLPTIK